MSDILLHYEAILEHVCQLNTQCFVVVAGVIPSPDPTDACYYKKSEYKELNNGLKELTLRSGYQKISSYLDIPSEFVSLGTSMRGEYSAKMIHLNPKGAEHLSSIVKNKLMSLPTQL